MRPQNVWNIVFRFARRHRLAAVGGAIAVVFLLLALLAPWLAPHDPSKIAMGNALRPPGSEFPLGTDHLGRDLLSRIIYGARISLSISCAAVAISMSIGVFLGLLAGWSRRLDMPIMRMMDVLLCFPGIITALTIIAVLGIGSINIVIAIAIAQVPQFARVARSLTLSVKENAYVEAAVSIGAKAQRILGRHILPNIFAPLLVQLTLLIPAGIMTIASLSFLGLGVRPPTAEWGSMLQGSLQWARLAPHVMIFPGLALMLVVFAFNTLGDGLRAALDPRLRSK
ncbi:MAG: ABC transporter permease [Chloroflexi bacterium]|nr:ABC transporter permease [Chloroflexota bacterium]